MRTAIRIASFSLILLIMSVGSAFAANVDTSMGWHPLRQIAKTSSDLTSVDSSGNGIIDNADTSANSMACSSDGTCEVNSLYSTGKVGIGIAPQAESLHVAGYGSFDNQLNIRSGTLGWTQIQSLGSGLVIKTDTANILLNPFGNVGIGTANPTQKLDVAGYVKGTGLCIGDVCKDSWPVSTDTRCDQPGVCSQVCIAGTCKDEWPTGSTGTITAVNAGSGLTGGGTTGAVTLDVGAGSGISVAADTVGLAYPSKSCSGQQAIQSFDLGSGNPPTCITPSDSDWIISGNNMYSGVPGNVGIGTSNPLEKLDVNGTLRIYSPDGKIGETHTYTYQNQSTENGFLTPQCGCDQQNDRADCPYSYTTSTDYGDVCYDQFAVGRTMKSNKYVKTADVVTPIMGITTALDVVHGNIRAGSLFVNGTTGYVGIGTTTPTSTLTVNGNIRTTTLYSSADDPINALSFGNGQSLSGKYIGSVTGGNLCYVGMSSGGGMAIVTGSSPDASNLFTDLVLWAMPSATKVASSATYGSPAARTYSISSPYLQFSLSGSNPYYTRVACLKANG